VSGKDAAAGDTRAGCRNDVDAGALRAEIHVCAHKGPGKMWSRPPPSRNLSAVIAGSQSKQFSVFTPLLQHLRLLHRALRSNCIRQVPLPHHALAYLAFPTDSLLLPVMPSPSSMLYYAVHPQQLRSMIQWCAYTPKFCSATAERRPLSNTASGKSGTTPFTSATSPRRRKTSSDASTFST
jgi:hypothetical protein